MVLPRKARPPDIFDGAPKAAGSAWLKAAKHTSSSKASRSTAAAWRHRNDEVDGVKEDNEDDVRGGGMGGAAENLGEAPVVTKDASKAVKTSSHAAAQCPRAPTPPGLQSPCIDEAGEEAGRWASFGGGAWASLRAAARLGGHARSVARPRGTHGSKQGPVSRKELFGGGGDDDDDGDDDAGEADPRDTDDDGSEGEGCTTGRSVSRAAAMAAASFAALIPGQGG
jgi:hypothetical protein